MNGSEALSLVSLEIPDLILKKEDQEKLLKDATYFTTFGTNSEEGSGLGLLWCRDFVQKNAGHLWFESEEGIGSEFSFSLPVNAGVAAC